MQGLGVMTGLWIFTFLFPEASGLNDISNYVIYRVPAEFRKEIGSWFNKTPWLQTYFSCFRLWASRRFWLSNCQVTTELFWMLHSGIITHKHMLMIKKVFIDWLIFWLCNIQDLKIYYSWLESDSFETHPSLKLLCVLSCDSDFPSIISLF